jgi:hypothetical protein
MRGFDVLLGLAMLTLGCRMPPAVIAPAAAQGAEPLVSGSLTLEEGRIGPDPDAVARTSDPPPSTDPFARFSGEPLERVVDQDGLVISDHVLGLGPAAQTGDTVQFHYVGILLDDGREFDSTYARKRPFEFEIGSVRVIPGLERGMIGARQGMLRVLTIPSALAYGEKGVGTVIPAGATLVFYIEVLGVVRP